LLANPGHHKKEGLQLNFKLPFCFSNNRIAILRAMCSRTFFVTNEDASLKDMSKEADNNANQTFDCVEKSYLGSP